MLPRSPRAATSLVRGSHAGAARRRQEHIRRWTVRDGTCSPPIHLAAMRRTRSCRCLRPQYARGAVSPPHRPFRRRTCCRRRHPRRAGRQACPDVSHRASAPTFLAAARPQGARGAASGSNRGRRPSHQIRCSAGRFLSNVQPGIRYCMAAASSRAPRPSARYSSCAAATASSSSSTPRPFRSGTVRWPSVIS